MHSHFKTLAGTVWIAVALLVLVLAFSTGFVVETVGANAPLSHIVAYLLAGGALCYGAFAHVLCHYGYVRRRKLDRRAGPDVAAGRRQDFGALIPSYREEPEFVYRAMLSVALQRNRGKWLRLLIDDPPDPQTPQQRHLLDASRALPDRVAAFLAPLESICRRAEQHAARPGSDPGRVLARTHRRLAIRLARLARDWPDTTPDDRFFRAAILAELAMGHMAEARAIPDHSVGARAALSDLTGRFRCDVAAFERKRFANLSHAANKAMNLNTGLDLIGRRLASAQVSGQTHLLDDPSGSVLFPPAEFVVTLDADSLLAPAYAETLLALAGEPGADRVAVVQTPYASLPEPATTLEALAGATTDVQRITHQGFQHFDAAFWVGANAVLRMTALRDIAVADEERGHPIRRYIQDRTPIEDTESTIDLALKGWRVQNHDAMLAWSATPPDFGALVIQRRRWACGGAIILPKAIRAAAASPGSFRAAALQLLVRGHYLGSLMWVPTALVLLLLAPFDEALSGVFLPLVAVPYFLAYALDLALAGQPVRRLFSIYGLNLLLVPVNLAGAFASIRQAALGRKVPFVRTPKIADRTAAPIGILSAVWGGAALMLASAGFDASQEHWAHAAFSLVNGAALLAAAAVHVGLRASREDVAASLAEFRRRQRRQRGQRTLGPAPATAAVHLAAGHTPLSVPTIRDQQAARAA